MLTDCHSGLRWWLSCPVPSTHRDREKISCAWVREVDGWGGRGLEQPLLLLIYSEHLERHDLFWLTPTSACSSCSPVGAVDLQPGCLYGAFSSTPDAWQTLIAVCHPLPAERPLRFMWHKLNHLKVKILPDSQPCSGYIVEEAESSFLQGEVTENGVFSLFPDASSVDMHRAAARPG